MSKKREVKAVAIKGLNKKDTINSVDDGWCGKAHNIACRDGKFQTVHEHTTEGVLALGEYEIIYVHPILPASDYIAKRGNEVVHIRTIDGIIIKSIIIKTLDYLVNPESIRVYHFEDVLFLCYQTSGVDYQESFVYNNEKYNSTKIESLGEFLNININYEYYIPSKENSADPATRIATFTTATDASGNKYVSAVDKRYENIYADMKRGNYLHGAIYLMFAYKMKDGSIMRNGKIHMLDSEYGRDGNTNSLYRVNKSATDVRFYKDFCGFKVKLNFYNPNDIRDIQAIKSIIVYSTRNNPLFDFENAYNNFPTDSSYYEKINSTTDRTSSKFIFDKRNYDILSSPFYAVAEVDFRSTYHLTLSASDYEGIELKPIFSPLVSPHNYIAAGSFGLNRRLHQYDITAQLYKSAQQVFSLDTIVVEGVRYNNRMPSNSYDLSKLGVSVTLNVAGEKSIVNTLAKGDMMHKVIAVDGDTVTYSADPYLVIPNVISYPDVRATKIELFFTRIINGVTQTVLLRSYDLQPVPSNNYACYRDLSRDALMSYEVVNIKNIPNNNFRPIENRNTCRLPNQLMVSEIGKPHAYNPEHIYYIGDNDTTKIESVNTPTDQLTESRFGQYPLYLFTTTGIYAMEQGADTTLYQSIVKVNNDIICSGSNSMSATGALYYFTQAGLIRLNGPASKIASDVINGEIQNFINGSVLSLIPAHGELMVTNKNYKYAYVYSITTGVWTTRDFTGKMISYDRYIRDNSIYNLQLEDNEQPLTGHIETRELSLNSNQMKHLDRLKAEIISSGAFTITLLASLDGEKWCELSKSVNCTYINRTNSSWRWYKVKIDGDNFILNNIIFESFVRFTRHIL